MLPYFPIPYPDETLYSVLSRYHMCSGNLKYVHTIKDLFGAETVGLNLDFVSGIDVLLQKLGHDSLSADSLIYNHTALPYFAAFIPKDRVKKAEIVMKNSNDIGAHLRLGINGYGIKNNRYFRHCAECIEDDIKKFGETYWHRIHQLPGVFVCPKHKRNLLQYEKKFKEIKSREFLLANDDLFRGSKEFQFSANDRKTLTMIATESQWLLNNRIIIDDSNYYSDKYLPLLQNIEVATVEGKIKRKKWFNLLTSVYDDELLSVLQSKVDERKESNWFDQIVRNRKSTFHPIRHLLIILFLSSSLKEFYLKDHKYTPFGEGPWPCLNYAHPHYDEKTIAEVIIKNTQGRPSGKFACECGFIYSRRGPDKNEKDLFRRGQIVRYGPVWDNKLKELIKQNVSDTEIAKSLGVTRTTIKRKRNKLENVVKKIDVMKEYKKKVVLMKKSWINLMKQNPNKTLNQLKKIDRKLHYWLHKNEYFWLKENTPSAAPNPTVRKYIDWGKRDKELLIEVKKVISEWKKYEDNGLRKRTKYSIARKTLSPHYITKHPDKIPLTINFINNVIESDEEFHLRKVNWAYKGLLEQGINQNFTTLLKKSKISSQQLTPVVERHIIKIIG